MAFHLDDNEDGDPDKFARQYQEWFGEGIAPQPARPRTLFPLVNLLNNPALSEKIPPMVWDQITYHLETKWDKENGVTLYEYHLLRNSPVLLYPHLKVILEGYMSVHLGYDQETPGRLVPYLHFAPLKT